MTKPVAGIILAAGKGTRMKSELPKVLHKVCGVPMVDLVGRAMKEAGVSRPVIVIGHGGELVQESLGDAYDYVWQREQKGTGHAALMAAELLKDHQGPVLISPGDTPLLRGSDFAEVLSKHCESGALCTAASMELSDPSGYGRLVREGGNVVRIVEEKDADDTIRAITEVNVGLYCFDSKTLFNLLPHLSTENAQGEYYLPDVVEAIAKEGGRAEGCLMQDASSLTGVNDRWQLAEAELALRQRILKTHALAGVTLQDINSITIGPDVRIGKDTVIEPSTYLLGDTVIGERCHVGPSTRIEDSKIGNGCRILMSHVAEAEIGADVRCGPFANIRPGTRIGERVKIGNFVEVKNSEIGDGTAVSHLTYIGDSALGEDTNIGAGTITCNYDGFSKHRTTIGSNVFVGSNTTLVAPVEIGDGAIIAAGSVITHNVPGEALGIARTRQEVKEEWAVHWRNRKRQVKS